MASNHLNPRCADKHESIDAVYTWVDGQDPSWQRAYGANARGPQPDPLAADTAARYFNRDQLRYSLRSLEMYAPFIRHVYLVTANQVPAWLDVDHRDLTLISHSDLFPEVDHLPTFNSHAIEAHLHRIDGLSEHFIYMNDDVFFARKTSFSDFFDPAGRPIIYLDKRRVFWRRIVPGYHGLVHCAARNNSRILEERFGFRIKHRVDHAPYALRKSTIEELWRLLPEELNRTSANRTRNASDLALPSSLAQYYGLCTGTCIGDRRPRSTYIKVKGGIWNQLRAQFALRRAATHATPPRTFLSVNDSGRFDGSPLTARLIRTLLKKRYPRASRFEKQRHTRLALGRDRKPLAEIGEGATAICGRKMSGVAVSVVIAALADSKSLRNCLEILRLQADALSPSAEVVLVLNAEKEAVSKESVAALTALCDVFEFEEAVGKSRALNRAIAVAQGRVIAFTDDDTRPEPEWLRRLTAPLLGPGREPNLLGCGGRVVPEFPEEAPAWYRQMTRHRPTTLLGPSHDLGPRRLDYSMKRRHGQSPVGASCAYRREVFTKHRYATRLGPNVVTGTRGGEDTELGRRLLMEGATLRYVPDAVVVHRVDPGRLGLSFCEQRFVAHGVEKIRSRRILGRAVPSAWSVRLYRQLSGLRLVVAAWVPGWTRERIALEGAVLRGMIAELEGTSDRVLGTSWDHPESRSIVNPDPR